MDVNTARAFVTFVVGAAGGGAGAYLGSYLKKKGENVATHEDIDKLVEQVAAVTRTTKEIEARISNEVWDRQKQWEFKKEAIFEVLRTVGSLHSTLGNLHSTYETTPGGELDDQRRRIEAYEEYAKIYEDFTRAAGVASVVVNKNVDAYLAQLPLMAGVMVREASNNNVAGSWAKVEEFTHTLHKLQAAIRVDLGIGPP